jgi:hypothetical protein
MEIEATGAALAPPRDRPAAMRTCRLRALREQRWSARRPQALDQQHHHAERHKGK